MEDKRAIVIFYDSNKNLLIQDRKNIGKKGADYGFFGGGLEKDETPEQALKREIREELTLSLEVFDFLFDYSYPIDDKENTRRLYVYLSPMPNLKKIKVNEGKSVVININELDSLDFSATDKIILSRVLDLLITKI